MRDVTIKIKVYKFDELSGKARETAINNEINFLLEVNNSLMPDLDSDGVKKAIAKAEAMRTPWFVGSYVWEYCEDEILSNLREYEFTDDGKIYCKLEED